MSSVDAALLEILSAPPSPAVKGKVPRRDAALDPLMIAAALGASISHRFAIADIHIHFQLAASGPQITRNHAAHHFNPSEILPVECVKGAPEDSRQQRKRLAYVSRQAPRRQRLGDIQIPEAGKENDSEANIFPSPVKKRRPSLATPSPAEAMTRAKASVDLAKPAIAPLTVKCMARTRIPTPHGPAFLHLYHNNRDSKEHLAIVVDPRQYSEDSDIPPIRSASLDAVWDPNETEMDRITRGAYIGKLSAASRVPSAPPAPSQQSRPFWDIPPPLVRIHSECFTGETIGSMRCDCGEQLDEALRLISQPISATVPGRGAVIYLRQEGRGIGLLSKIRAYNLQDLGHDTVAANLMLGHGADERGYEIAGAILRDLGLAPKSAVDPGEGIRLLTNNPDKVESLQSEGVRVVERVPMVPRSWRLHDISAFPAPGATLIGGLAVHGPDLDKYLRTKVLKMGHMLPLLGHP
ncbi:Gtp cyclohydrolase-2 [Mycena kentingensis (nom. inval.)]|nr:Gtp cyclohydrolase-2 [Mycena kentingensis (nom. inval.)]